MRTHRRRRYVTAVLAALSVSVAGPTAALAVPADTPVPLRAERRARWATRRPSSARPARSSSRPPSRPATRQRDFPGASRAPEYNPPTTIAVVRPERTIVRDTDPVLPIILGGLALLVALGTAGAAVHHSRHPNLSRLA